MIPFPKIRQYKSVIKEIRHYSQHREADSEGVYAVNREAALPNLNYIGTVKLHGTNASVRLDQNGNLSIQSRGRILSLESDNAGFARFVIEAVGEDYWKNILSKIRSSWETSNGPNELAQITAYGEWCGGNIQKGIAISGLDKMFVAFSICITIDEKRIWLEDDYLKHFNSPEQRVYNSLMFKCFNLNIDFENPGLSQNELVNITNSVEEECPVGVYFGVSGIGEGVVWRPDCTIHPDFNDAKFWFKVKGELHSETKIKTLVPINAEKAKGISEFVEMFATENRFEKGISFFKENEIEISIENTGKFIQWVVKDIFEEEEDTITASNIEKKDISKQISQKSKLWFFKILES